MIEYREYVMLRLVRTEYGKEIRKGNQESI